MNLREMKSNAHALIGDISMQDVKPQEMVSYINFGQNQIANFLNNIVRERFLTKATIAGVNATELYDLPSDFLDEARVVYADFDCSPIAVKSLGATNSQTGLTNQRAKQGVQQFYYIYGGTGSVPQIGILPTPVTSGLGNIVVWYYKKPTEFHEEGSYPGTLTEVGTSTTRFTDANAPFAGSATKVGVNDFWNNAEIRFTGGNNSGVSRRVSDFSSNGGTTSAIFTVDAGCTTTQTVDSAIGGADDDYNGQYVRALVVAAPPPAVGETALISDYTASSGTIAHAAWSGALAAGDTIEITADGGYGQFALSSALPNTPAIGDTYELDQVSIIPPEYHHLIVLWAAAMAQGKLGKDPTFFNGQFELGLAAARSKYESNLEKLTAGQTASTRVTSTGQ